MGVKHDIANYRRIEQAISFLESNFQNQPSLDEIASNVGLSKYHFQRLFKSFAGITPTQFMHYLTVEYAKSRLIEASSVFESALDSGLSGGGRLHDMFVSIEAVTPGEYKEQGKGVIIQYGTHSTPFGNVFIAITKRGICSIRFVGTDEDANRVVMEMKSEWPNANFRQDQSATRSIIGSAFGQDKKAEKLTLRVKGTNFQIKVWQALLKIPEGYLVSYQDVATHIGKPDATRAVASAIARNPIAYLIPCHRVISKAGKLHQYRWGQTRKKILIGYEAARFEQKD